MLKIQPTDLAHILGQRIGHRGEMLASPKHLEAMIHLWFSHHRAATTKQRHTALLLTTPRTKLLTVARP